MEIEKQFFYTNGAEIAVSPYDLNIKFLRQGTPEGASGNPVGNNIQPTTMAELTVAMSLSHAKTLLPGLYQSIIDYERSFGLIAVTPDAQNIFDTTFKLDPKK